jgi:hypothetical protein
MRVGWTRPPGEQPRRGWLRRCSAVATAVEDAREGIERVGDARPLGPRQALQERRHHVAPPIRYGLGGSLPSSRQANVGLTAVLGAAPTDDVAAPLQAGEVTACRRGVDAEHQRKRRCGDDAALSEELQRFGLLRSEIGTRRPSPLPTEAAQRARHPLQSFKGPGVGSVVRHRPIADRQGRARRQWSRATRAHNRSASRFLHARSRNRNMCNALRTSGASRATKSRAIAPDHAPL